MRPAEQTEREAGNTAFGTIKRELERSLWSLHPQQREDTGKQKVLKIGHDGISDGVAFQHFFKIGQRLTQALIKTNSRLPA